MNQKLRHACFTLNNPTDEQINALNDWDVKYLVYGHEECPTTGTPHLQGYVEFKDSTRFGTVKRKFPTIHIEKRQADALTAANYCKKGFQSHEEWKEFGTEGPNYGTNAVIFEKGEISGGKQGKRTDIDNVKDMLHEGKGMRHIVEHATSYQSAKFAELYLKYNERKRDWKPKVTWIWGPTGAGKTKQAFELLEKDCWISSRNLQWWDGYDAHENVLIDEFRGDFCTFHELLRILDRYPYRVQNKGGSRELLAKNIVITSCFPPDKVYQAREDIGQLLRRIDDVIFLGEKFVPQNVPQKSAGNTNPLEAGMPPTKQEAPETKEALENILPEKNQNEAQKISEADFSKEESHNTCDLNEKIKILELINTVQKEKYSRYYYHPHYYDSESDTNDNIEDISEEEETFLLANVLRDI